MALGLGSKVSKTGLTTPGIVTDNLVLKHKYDANSVVPLSNGAASFDGTDDYINFGSDSSIDMGTSAFSVTFWTYLDTVGNTCFVGKGPSIVTEDSGWAISLLGSNGRVYFDINNSGRDATYSNTGAITANKWYHIAVVRPASDGAGRKIYVNGAENVFTSSNSVSDAGDASVDLWFGDVPTGGTRELDGYMCNVGIWKDRVLTQPEIKSIMNKNYAGLTDGEKTNLAGWWNLDETIETTNIADEPNIVLDNNASNTEILNWESNFSGTGITENANVGNFDVNANPPYTESYIDNDNKTVRLRAISDGPDDGDSVDHIQVKTLDSLTVGKSYKIVVTVDSISGRFRVRPGTGSAAADMTTTGVHTFYFHKSPSSYWRLERDAGVGDITVSDIKIYDIGYTGELL